MYLLKLYQDLIKYVLEQISKLRTHRRKIGLAGKIELIKLLVIIRMHTCKELLVSMAQLHSKQFMEKNLGKQEAIKIKNPTLSQLQVENQLCLTHVLHLMKDQK